MKMPSVRGVLEGVAANAIWRCSASLLAGGVVTFATRCGKLWYNLRQQIQGNTEAAMYIALFSIVTLMMLLILTYIRCKFAEEKRDELAARLNSPQAMAEAAKAEAERKYAALRALMLDSATSAYLNMKEAERERGRRDLPEPLKKFVDDAIAEVMDKMRTSN